MYQRTAKLSFKSSVSALLAVLLVAASAFALRHRFIQPFLQSAHAATFTAGVTSTNDSPDAVDDEVVTAEDTALTIDVLSNDTDADGDPLSVESVAQPGNGWVSVTEDGAVEYTPAENFYGTDTFTYTASDGQGGTDTATVSVTVTDVNDAPVAVADDYSTGENTTLTIPAPGVLSNDSDVEGSALTPSLLSLPTRGFVSLNEDGSFTYTPADHYNGADSFTYRTSDNGLTSNTVTVTITINAIRWSLTGNLNTARSGHTATLLADGTVLVAGGNAGTPSSAEIYHLETGTWSVTGDLNERRSGHTATLLQDGRVLVVGGTACDPDFPSTAELYDPATGVWSPAGHLNMGCAWNHTATLLPNGNVLVAGGKFFYTRDTYGVATGRAELFDPITGTWSSTGGLSVPRWGHTATLLEDGRVLVVAGWREGSSAGYMVRPQTSAELYDPANGTWSATGNLSGRLDSHSAALLLPDGKVLVMGNYYSWGDHSAAELYDPATGSWSRTGNFDLGRNWYPVTMLPDGKILVFRHASIIVELYDAVTGTWTVTSSLNPARSGHTATLLLDGTVLVAGGNEYNYDYTYGDVLSSAAIYHPEPEP